jgi:hypothetical protein
MFVSYSTGAGSVASDGRVGGHGLFTESLIKHMKRGLDLRDVFQQTRAEVYSKSNKKQFPAIYNQTINGKFYFTQPTGGTTQLKNYTPPQVVREPVRRVREVEEEPIDISPYPINKIPPKRTHVKEEEPEKYYHPPEDYSSGVGY